MKRKISLFIVLCLIVSAFASFALADSLTGVIKTPAVDGSVNLRSQGSAKYPVIGWAKNGAQVEILYQGNYWHKVRLLSSGKVGWVSAKYVKITGYADTAYAPDSSSAIAAAVSTKYPNSTVNLRAGAGVGYAVLGEVGRGARLSILSSEGNWYQAYVPAKGITAWISKTYVSLGLAARATGDVNLRTGPSKDYSRIAVIKKGANVTLLSEGASWSQVSYNGQTGYISNKYWAYR
ncbi:MAG: SH3 domain-containing protein [Clostridia bacterium]|nr:SH3 domain-containing protein [Clostridia bacterium]